MAIFKKITLKTKDDTTVLPLTTASQVIKSDGTPLETSLGVNADTLGGVAAANIVGRGDFEVLWSGNAASEQNLTLAKPMSEFTYLLMVSGHNDSGGVWMDTHIVPVELLKTRFTGVDGGRTSLLFHIWNGGYVCVYAPSTADNLIHVWNFNNGAALTYIGGIK